MWKNLKKTVRINMLSKATASKTIVAFEPIRNIEITSVCIDIVTTEETQLDIRNIVLETANITREASICVVKVLDDNRFPAKK